MCFDRSWHSMAAICEGRPSVAALMSGISSRVTRYYVTAQEAAERDAAVGSVGFGPFVTPMAMYVSKSIESNTIDPALACCSRHCVPLPGGMKPLTFVCMGDT